MFRTDPCYQCVLCTLTWCEDPGSTCRSGTCECFSPWPLQRTFTITSSLAFSQSSRCWYVGVIHEKKFTFFVKYVLVYLVPSTGLPATENLCLYAYFFHQTVKYLRAASGSVFHSSVHLSVRPSIHLSIHSLLSTFYMGVTSRNWEMRKGFPAPFFL